MSKTIDDFLKGMKQNFIRAKFTNIKPDKSNIDKVYLNNINIWYYRNSDSVIKKDGKKEVRSKLDTINNVILLNPENFIFCKTQNGFKLTEDDFINSELKRLEELDVNKLLLAENKQFEYYKNFLLNKLEKPQQLQDIKPDEIKKELHNNIFKDNAFEVWHSMFVKFKIIESNYSTDIDFMFEVMKYNNLIHKNIGLTDIKNWVNKVYEILFEKIRYTNPKSTANQKRLIIYNDIISK
jgi:hypothetical protein